MTTAEQLAQTIKSDLEMLCDSEELTADRRASLARIVEHLTPPNLLALLDELERKDALIDEQDKRLVDYAAIATKSATRVAALEKKTAFLKEKLAHLAKFNPDWDVLEATTDSLREHMSELTAANKRIAELEAISSAAEKLVRCKGRYHSEQNYRALAALFGVTTPDLPPLESEARTVTVKLPELKMLSDYLSEVSEREREEILVGVRLEFFRALRAAGVTVEG